MTTQQPTTAPTEEEHRSIWAWLRDLPFNQSWIDVDGVSTRVLQTGLSSGPTVVLLHGTGGHWEVFAPNLKQLSESFRVVAIDMIGNGFTDKPDYPYEISVYVKHLARTFEILGIERASIVGISLGAWVAARFAHDVPERVERLVLMSPAGLTAKPENMARIKRQRTTAVDNPSWESLHAVFAHLIADERNRLPDVIAVRQAIYRLPETRATIDHLLILQDYEVRTRNLLTSDEWRNILAPVLVVASGKDYAEYETTARQIIELLPNAELLEMPNVGHWPSFEDPETFGREALRFLTA